MNTSLQILICIAVIIVAAKLAGALAARLGLPHVLGELLAGVLLGPTWLNLWGFSWLAPNPGSGAASAMAIFKALADIGVVLLMFIAGLETDLSMMRRAVTPALWAATGGVILPMAAGFWTARRFGFSAQEAIFIGTILTATSVTITAHTLMNLNRLKSEAGSTILSAAVIDDVLGLIVLSLVIALGPRIGHASSGAWREFAITLGRMAFCLVTMMWLGPPITRWALRNAPRLHGNHTQAAAALVIALLLASHAEWVGGMAAITGAYLAGLFVAQTPSQQKVATELHPMVNSFFGPLFFVSIGLEVNAWKVGTRVGLFLILLLVAILGKVLGSGLGAYLNKFSPRDALAVGIGMIPRGEVGLITASLGFAAGLVSSEVYVQVVVLVLGTTLITPGLLKLAFTGQPAVESVLIRAAALEELPAAIAETADA
jgi:Kef-type K+ transport system membrane component KefB